MTIGDRDKVFADLNNPQPERIRDNGGGAGEAKLGVVVQEVPPAIAASIHTSGVIIDSVQPGSFADLQGLSSGLGHHACQPAADPQQGSVRCRGEQAQDRRRCGFRGDRPPPSRTWHQLHWRHFIALFGTAPAALISAAGAGSKVIQVTVVDYSFSPCRNAYIWLDCYEAFRLSLRIY